MDCVLFLASTLKRQFVEMHPEGESLDSTVDYEKECSKCGNRGVIYGKAMCHSCYFGFEKQGSKDRLL